MLAVTNKDIGDKTRTLRAFQNLHFCCDIARQVVELHCGNVAAVRRIEDLRVEGAADQFLVVLDALLFYDLCLVLLLFADEQVGDVLATRAALLSNA